MMATLLDGILDELVAAGGQIVADIQFTLLEAKGADPLSPNASAFYRAARGATRKLLEGNIFETWSAN